MKKIIPLSLSVLSLFIMLLNIPINPLKEAYALQQVTVNTTGSFQQVRFITVGSTPAFIVLSGSPPTQIQVINANNSAIISSFNMTNALMNGFNIVYGVRNMDCNSSLQICVIGYDTGGSGTCSISPNLCRDRVVLVDYKNSLWSALKNGYNYTYTSNILGNVAISFGQTQYNIFATYQPNGGGNALIDTLVFNSTDGVNQHPLIFGNTFTTTTNTNYANSALGTFTIAGVINNYEAEVSSTSTTSFIDFNRGLNTVGCSVALGTAPTDAKYVSDSVGTFWYITTGTTLDQISQTSNTVCTVTNSVNLSALTGANNLNSVAIDSTRHEVYTQSNGKIYVINETSFSSTPILTFSSTTTTDAGYNGLASYQNGFNGALASGSSTSKILVTYWNVQGSGGTPPSNNNTCNSQSPTPHCVGQMDCDLSQNQNIAQCYIIFNPRSNGFQGTGGMLNSSATQLYCSIGLIKCNFDANGNGTPLNSDVKTNGVGYLIAIIGLAILISLFWVASDHDLRNIPTFVWFIAVLGLLGAMVALNWLDPTFFIIAIIALVGLGVAKAKGVLLGDSF